ncbi:methyl-accepting chemotaxis protein [Methanofollis sp. W23]|uniref:methyl-accepting chemotaxis protein n=1 Tax=Methanofollis sp. W23 TaxID=2817849 RepID=UPI001AE3AE3C|nr:PAS domain-containing methyl-accepting chemotaxis protein [Methanofollis sp. W23]MBP2147001.1 methyl-accepting chemotaxis protein [Methanofollis sp. W23]
MTTGNPKKVEDILEQALNGDYSVRVNEDQVTDEFKPLARMVNKVVRIMGEREEERKELEKLKKRSEAFLKYNPQAIAVLAGDKHRLDLNKEYERAWHGTYDELMAKKLYDFDIKTSGDDFYASYQTKKLAISDMEVSWEDGTTSYLRLFQVPILDDDGEIDVNYYIYQDLTEQKKELKKVKALQKRADAFVNQNPLAIAVLAGDKHRLDLNKEYERVWHGTYDELMAKKLYDFDIKTSGDDFYASYQTKKLAVSDMEVSWEDGTTSYLRLFQVPILDDDGEIDVNYYIYQDLTEQTKKLKEVELLQKRSDAFINQNPQAIAVLAGDKHRLDLNKKYEEVWRGSYDELMAKKLYDFDIKTSGDDFYASYQTKKLAVSEMEVSWEDHTKSYLRLYQLPILNDDGEIDVNYYIYQDNTDLILNELKTKDQARRLAESAEELKSAMDEMAAGDLTTLVNIGDDDLLKDLKLNYRHSRESIKEVLKKITDLGNRVEASTKESGRSAEDISKAVEQVATKSQQTAEDAKKQLENLEEVARSMADLSASIEEIASTSQEVLKGTESAVEAGDEAEEIGREATQKMGEVERITKKGVEEFSRLKDEMNEISKIVKLINDISNQTNLLALNAAIEAARAGEHGRGFAVVAGEVRNLAGESKNATNHIEELIGSIQAKSEQTAHDLSAAFDEITAGITSVNKTIDAMNQIVSASKEAHTSVTEIARATEDQANSTNSVMERMDSTNTMTRDTMSRIEDMAALAEEVSASAEEVGSGAMEVADMAGEMKESLDRFKLE